MDNDEEYDYEALTRDYEEAMARKAAEKREEEEFRQALEEQRAAEKQLRLQQQSLSNEGDDEEVDVELLDLKNNFSSEGRGEYEAYLTEVRIQEEEERSQHEKLEALALRAHELLQVQIVQDQDQDHDEQTQAQPQLGEGDNLLERDGYVAMTGNKKQEKPLQEIEESVDDETRSSGDPSTRPSSAAESLRLRDELESFLKETKAKISEDGSTLVHFPKSFDEISSAMDREDIADVDVNKSNWSKEIFNQEYTTEDSRYTKMLSDEAQEMKVQRGVAKIEMLDKKLLLLAKKAKAGFQEDDFCMNGSDINGDDENTLNTGRTEVNSIGSPPSTARSNASVRSTSTQDAMNGLFMTKVKRTNSRADFGHRSLQESRPSSAKRPPSSMSTSSQMSGVPLTKKEKESHRKALLAPDLEETELWEDISRYGYSAAEKATMDDIDRQLSELSKFDFNKHCSEDLDFLQDSSYSHNEGDLEDEANNGDLTGRSTLEVKHRNISRRRKGDDDKFESVGNQGGRKNINTNKETHNFLAASRLERVRQQYMATLDQALGKFAQTNRKVLLDEDISCLLDKEPPAPRIIATPPTSRSSRRSNEAGGSGGKLSSRNHTSSLDTSRVGTAKSTRSVRSNSSSTSQITYQDVQKTIRETIDGYRSLEGLEPYTDDDYNDYNDNVDVKDKNHTVRNNNHEEQDVNTGANEDEKDYTPNRTSRKKNKKKLVSVELLAPDDSLKDILQSIENDVMRLENLKKQSNSPGSSFGKRQNSQSNYLPVREYDDEADYEEGDDGGSRFMGEINDDNCIARNYDDVNDTGGENEDCIVHATDVDATSPLFIRRQDHDNQQLQQRISGTFSPVYQSQIPTLPAISRRNGSSSNRSDLQDPNTSIMRGMVRDGNKSLRL